MLVLETGEQKHDGYWRDYPPMPGVSFKIRPISRSQFRRYLTEVKQEYPGETDMDGLMRSDLMDQKMHRHMVIDWKGVVDSDGNDIPRSDAMVDVLMSQMLQLADWVADQARKLSEDEARRKAAKLKNSKSSCGGSETAQKA